MNEKSKYKEKLNKQKEERRADIHSFHRYYGKLIPAIPNVFIREFTNEGDTIGDLFSGSGTVAVESKILNRNFIGSEINPLSHFISEVKVTHYDYNTLKILNEEIERLLSNYDNSEKMLLENLPYCINMDHWFREEVQKDLLVIKAVIDKVITESALTNNDKNKYKHFYYAIVSSIIRNVSNADPAHVFPGISKRIRRLEEEGKIYKDARKTFITAIRKKSKYYTIYNGNEPRIEILNNDSIKFNAKKYKNTVDLFVTNPPYISSVRYIETMKLEMYWLEYIKNSDEYSSLAKRMLGNDKISKNEIDNKLITDYDEINETISKIRKISEKDAFIVAKYFNDMEKIIIKMNQMLKLNGKVVVKISDSNVKKVKVETGKFLTLIAENYEFKMKDVFLDKIVNRSLLTARNTYSDIILNDHIIVWEKVGELDV
jgi:hypothetical protein